MVLAGAFSAYCEKNREILLTAVCKVELEYEEIIRGVEEGSRASASFMEVFQRGNLTPLIIAVCLMVGQQLSGMNAVMFYAVSIFEDAGSTLNNTVANLIIGAVQVRAFNFTL